MNKELTNSLILRDALAEIIQSIYISLGKCRPQYEWVLDNSIIVLSRRRRFKHLIIVVFVFRLCREECLGGTFFSQLTIYN